MSDQESDSISPKAREQVGNLDWILYAALAGLILVWNYLGSCGAQIQHCTGTERATPYHIELCKEARQLETVFPFVALGLLAGLIVVLEYRPLSRNTRFAFLGIYVVAMFFVYALLGIVIQAVVT